MEVAIAMMLVGLIVILAALAALARVNYDRAKNAYEWGVLHGIMLSQGDHPDTTPFGNAETWAKEKGLI